MAIQVQTRTASRIFRFSLYIALAAMPGRVAASPRAQLVHCGIATCLRISGHRAHSAVAVRIAGQPLSVLGNRAWHAIVPLETARGWLGASGDTLALTLVDPQTGTEAVDAVMVPPGALGRRIELAMLVVSAH